MEVLKTLGYGTRSAAYFVLALASIYLLALLFGSIAQSMASDPEDVASLASIGLLFGATPVAGYLIYKSGRNGYWSYKPESREKNRIGHLILGIIMTLCFWSYGIGFLIAWHRQKPNEDEEKNP